MELQNAVVHELQKDRRGEATVRCRETELDVNIPRVYTLVERVSALFRNRSGLAYGTLERSAGFNLELEKLENKSIVYLAFSNVLMDQLKAKIDRKPLATGGFMLFATVIKKMERFLYVVMLKNTDGLSFDNYLEVIDVNHIDLTKLHVAARINLSSRQQISATNYVAFVRGRSNKEIAEYFQEFLSMETLDDSRKSTTQLINAITNFGKEKELAEQEVEQLRNRCHSYLSEKAVSGEPVYVDEFSHFLDEADPTAFLTYINDSGTVIGTDFHVDKHSLKRLITYSGKDKDVTIRFTNAAFGTRVRYDPDKDLLTIQPVPEDLRPQLRGDPESRTE